MGHKKPCQTTLCGTILEAPKRVMVLGDSNALQPGSHANWPALLESRARDCFYILNESHAGRTTCHDSGELDGLAIVGTKLAIHAPLNGVIVALGTNDAKHRYGPPSAADVAAGIRQIIEAITLQAGNIEIVLLTPPPVGRIAHGDLAGAQRRVARIAKAYRLLASNGHTQLVDIHAALNHHTDLEPDGVHLNASGRQKVADAVWASLFHKLAPNSRSIWVAEG